MIKIKVEARIPVLIKIAVTVSNEALTGKNIIEISHKDDKILKKTNTEKLIRLALLPGNSVAYTFKESMKKDTLHKDSS